MQTNCKHAFGALLYTGETMAMQKTALQTGPVERLATGFTFVEGPVWHRDGHWYFSDIPESRIHTVTPSGEVGVHRDPSGQSNGLTLDGAGRLLACEHGNRGKGTTS